MVESEVAVDLIAPTMKCRERSKPVGRGLHIPLRSSPKGPLGGVPRRNAKPTNLRCEIVKAQMPFSSNALLLRCSDAEVGQDRVSGVDRPSTGPFRCRERFGIILVSNWETEFMPISKMIETVKDYPIEDRVVFADAILQSINPIDPEVERKWIDLAQHRRGEYLQGHVTPIPSEEVFAEAKVRARA